MSNMSMRNMSTSNTSMNQTNSVSGNGNVSMNEENPLINDRTAVINIGGKKYEMLLTTRATKEIAKRYGGLENLGDKLMKSENFEMALDEIVWLITLLCNQPILVHNLKNPNDPWAELSTDEVELLTSPMELTDYKDAILSAMYKGTERHIESEDTAVSNASAGSADSAKNSTAGAVNP